MVDYSKWDRMDFSDSDGDEDAGGPPRVTSLDRPGKVTIGADGSLEIGKSSLPSRPRTPPVASSAPSASATPDIPTVSGSVGGAAIDMSSLNDVSRNDQTQAQRPNKQSKVQQFRSQRTRNGGEHPCATTIEGKDIRLPLYWSQDRYAVTLRLGFPSSLVPTRDVRVRVEGALPYIDRCSAVGSGVASSGVKGDAAAEETAHGSIQIFRVARESGEETVLLAGTLPRPVHTHQDEDAIDFEIEDNLGEGGRDGAPPACDKLVSITLPKAVPMAGLVLWWDRPLVGYPRIDVSTIRERRGKGTAPQNGDEKKEAFQKAWEQAHVMFRDKMKTKEKEAIDLSGS